MELFVGWFFVALACGIIAESKNRNGIGWFFIGAFLSLLALIMIAVMPALPQAQAIDRFAPSPKTHVRCPDCGELVLKQARVCKHCRCRLSPTLD